MSLRRSRAPGAKGFTLVELLIAVAVVAVLVALAAPSFRDLILMQRMKGIHAQLVTDLQYARSEAVSSGAVVNIRVRPPTVPSEMSCYIIFHHLNWNYGQFGASIDCNCTMPAGSRCTAAGTRELRTVQIPANLAVKLSIPDVNRQGLAFSSRNGAMVLKTNEAGLASGLDFAVTSTIDSARSVSAVVGMTGRPRICRPAGSTLPDPEC